LFHKSLILPIIAYLLTFVNNNPKNYFLFWLVSIPISLILGSTFELQIKNLTFITEGRDAYFDNSVDSAKFSRTGFRWDFVIYSSIGIIVAYFSVIKKKYSDELYIRILNIYLFCNAFWILIIRASFSNRFAYLSWFLLGLIIIYPFLKVKIIKNQYRFIGLILAVYYLITYTLNVILK
ncbi:MAG: EpsG family protein, partial [Pedobacter sp.]